MKRTLLLTAVIFLFSVGAYSQCPTDMVCISPEAARKAIVDADTVKAQALEIKALEQAVRDAQDNAHKMAIEFAKVSGENTALRQNDVSNRAIIAAIIPLMRKKCMPLSVCF